MNLLLPVGINLVKSLPRFLGKPLVGSNLWFTVQLQWTIGDEIYESVKQASPKAATHYFDCLKQPLERSRLANALSGSNKAILTRGQFDRIAKHDVTRKWAKVIGAEECEIPGVGHTPMVEAPRYYYELIDKMSCRPL
jgi:pimeloyl-ACP methyl ester carboxylesterase